MLINQIEGGPGGGGNLEELRNTLQNRNGNFFIIIKVMKMIFNKYFFHEILKIDNLDLFNRNSLFDVTFLTPAKGKCEIFITENITEVVYKLTSLIHYHEF